MASAARPAPAPSDGASVTIPAIAEDGTLYPIEKMEAHRLCVPHVAVSVFLVAGGRLLIQRRALGKYHCGGLWANTCCSHPHWDEPVADAAVRRLSEELGVTGVRLVPQGELSYRAEVSEGLVENERVHLYRGEPGPGTEFRPDPAEVSEIRWIGLSELFTEMAEDPDRFAPWFRIYLERRSDLMR